MSWFEPLAGIIPDHQGERESSAGRPRALAVCWGHEPLVGCRAKGALPLGSVRVPDRLGPGNQISTMDRRDKILEVFCGIDWAEAHHDVALVDDQATLIAKRRISDDAAGFAALIMLLADAGTMLMIRSRWRCQTSRGLLVACLRATGRRSMRSTRWRCPTIGMALGIAQEIRCRRRLSASPHSAHRHGRPPTSPR
jgi:hypothetical protein